eukprot:TRINITY_DN1776_c0_g1_i1.p1 TRINITY_DN1776_c0_g1~~TRINITY_DN1776_c0_g1_i1.p1  ORF type:complete len:486 (+),score=120.97 TRINITY_DN1776_c0_g1_i1:105-1460(+)
MAGMNSTQVKFGADAEKAFMFIEKVGEGSYGSVWKVHHRTGQVFAIKKIPFDDNADDITREVEFMRSLVSTYIVRYFGSYFVNKEVWIIMEYCGPGSVRSIMKHTKRNLSEDQISVVVRHVLLGLQYLHQKRKLHRDIKAGNILVDSSGTCKLADFGVSAQLNSANVRRHTMIGSPFWMSPEVIQDVGYDEHADIWSLGITIIEMAEGQPPHYDLNPMRVIFMIPNWPSPTLSAPDKYSPLISAFLAKCMVKDQANRPLTDELLKDPFVAPRANNPLLELVLEQDALVHASPAKSLSSNDLRADGSAIATSQGQSRLSLGGASTALRRLSLGDEGDVQQSPGVTAGSASGSIDDPGTAKFLETLHAMDANPQTQGTFARNAGSVAVCRRCLGLQQENEQLRAANVALSEKLTSVELRLERANTDLIKSASDANLYKGQCIVFEKLFMKNPL